MKGGVLDIWIRIGDRGRRGKVKGDKNKEQKKRVCI